MTAPVVSIIMPCFNSEATLPLALSSLIAQTYDHWECIVVDDGSTDNTGSLVELVKDSRIKYLRFADNRGRGAARAKAIDMAGGDYVAMLDADDWIYPWKIEHQLAVMEERREIALLSTGMAIVDHNNDIVGIRTPGLHASRFSIFPPLRAPMPPPVAHAPSMIRAEVAKQYRYDSTLRFVEDIDYLLEILLHHSFGISPEMTYVYAEGASATLAKSVGSCRYGRRIFAKYRSRFPRHAYYNEVMLLLKELYYRTVFMVGFKQRLVASRSNDPTREAIRQFHRARSIVYDTAKTLFPKHASCPTANTSQKAPQ